MRIGQYNLANDVSGNQFILTEASIVTDKTSKNFGKEILSKQRYFTSWQGALSYAAGNDMLEVVGGLESLEDCVKEFSNRLKGMADDIEKQLKAGK